MAFKHVAQSHSRPNCGKVLIGSVVVLALRARSECEGRVVFGTIRGLPLRAGKSRASLSVGNLQLLDPSPAAVCTELSCHLDMQIVC